FLSAAGFNGGTPANISFDPLGNSISVNNSFFDRCTPGTPTGCRGDAFPSTSTCSGGPLGPQGAGVPGPGSYCSQATSSGGGATGWLRSTAPVEPGEIMTIELMIWDTGDPAFDSSVLLDQFEWVPVPVPPQPETGRPPPPPPPH